MPTLKSQFAILLVALLATFSYTRLAQASHPETDSCPDSHIRGSESIEQTFYDRYTGKQYFDGDLLPVGSFIGVYGRATAYGRCEVYFVGVKPNTCVKTNEFKRLVYQINGYGTLPTMTVDYGWEVGRDPITGVTAFYHELDSKDDVRTSVGPMKYIYVSAAGQYTYQMKNVINGHYCQILPSSVSSNKVAFYGVDEKTCLGSDEDASVGNPCSTRTGNKHQAESDIENSMLPFARHYNSLFSADIGLGYGWSSDFHKRLAIGGTSVNTLRIVAVRGSGRSETYTQQTDGT